MGKRFLIGLAAVLALGLSSSAQAAPSAFTGTFQITIEGSSSGLAAFGGIADVSLATGSIVLPAIAASTSAFGSTHPAFTNISGRVTGGAPGTFIPSGGPSGGFGGNVPFQLATLQGSSTNGTSGRTISVFGAVIGSQGATAIGSSWSRWLTWTPTPPTTPTTSTSTTTSTWSNASLVASGWAANTINFTVSGRSFTATGSDARTAGRGGQIVLITPIRLEGGLGNGGLGGFATLTLDFAPVPEPGTALLLGSGLLGLAAAGRRRR